MIRRPANDAVKARAAVIGATSSVGEALKKALEGRGVAGSRVDLFGGVADGAILSEYDGEARLVRPLDLDEIGGEDVAFVCEGGPLADRVLPLAARGGLVLDLAGAWPGAPLVHPEWLALPSRGTPGPFAVPHALAVVLAEILRPLHAALGLRRASAWILCPASDAGAGGLEELREQTVQLLRFESPPTEVFGRQLAFNAIPSHLFPRGEGAVDGRIAAQAARLAGLHEPRVALRRVAIPALYGHGLSLQVELERGAEEDVRSAFRGGDGAGFEPSSEDGTLLDAGDRRSTRVLRCEPDGLGGFWLWAVAGEAMAASAEAAVAQAAAMADL